MAREKVNEIEWEITPQKEFSWIIQLDLVKAKNHEMRRKRERMMM